MEKMGLNDDNDGYKYNTPAEEPPVYTGMFGALTHVYLLALGEFDTDSYSNGDSQL